MNHASAMSVGRSVTTNKLTPHNPHTTPSKVVYPASRLMPSQRCCETGRPVLIDPITGGTICSCQLKCGMPAYFSRVAALPEAVYGASSSHVMPPNIIMGPESSNDFYDMSMKANRIVSDIKTASPTEQAPYYLDQLLAAHQYNSFFTGFDLNSARRKNATRETTSALKAWLYEHRKNPYPTKGEKIMLAIITRMTLTQVSTWFANARRRLKKETKTDDKDIDLLDVVDIHEKQNQQNGDIRLSVSDDEDAVHSLLAMSDISDDEDSASVPNVPNEQSAQRLFASEHRSNNTSLYKARAPETIAFTENQNKQTCVVKNSNFSTSSNDAQQIADTRNSQNSHTLECQPRPKIWSISEIISSNTSGGEK